MISPLTVYGHLARPYVHILGLRVRFDVQHLTRRRGRSSVGRNDRRVLVYW